MLYRDTPAHPMSSSSRPREEAVKVVLAMLHEHGMDVVFVGQYTEGTRRFRVVETLGHGPAAALATAGQDEAPAAGQLLEAPVVLRDGRYHGMLCCVSAPPDAASAERDLRWLRQGARLIARLIDNEQVLRELSAQSFSH